MTNKKNPREHKPVIETVVNTSAIALSTLGVIQVQKGELLGLILIVFAAGLEFFKYWGRKACYW
tara:strand:- start:397 stop:588 length:192 start_codon:yes stop_codon:yes gene_type:complete